MQQRWCLYALGGGGGHLARAYALARAAWRLGHRSKILARGPLASFLAAPMRSEIARMGSEIEIDVMPTSVATSAAGTWVGGQLQGQPFDRLVVDSFPRGLVGELIPFLSQWPRRKFLVARHMNAGYAMKPEVLKAVQAYDHLLLPGEASVWQSHCRHTVTAPWFVRDAVEIDSRSSVCTSLGIEPRKRIAVFVGTGSLQEIDKLHALSLTAKERTPLHVVWLSPTDAASWPAMNVLAAADVVVGSAGYNLVWECRALGVPLLCQVQHRLYDEQDKRIVAEQLWSNEEDLMEKLAYVSPRPQTLVAFDNGAHAASLLISV